MNFEHFFCFYGVKTENKCKRKNVKNVFFTYILCFDSNVLVKKVYKKIKCRFIRLHLKKVFK